jgi:hypothetical protein
MNRYRLFVFDENGRLIGPAVVVRATNEDEAVAQAEAIRRGLAAELLDFNRLRIVARFPDKSVQTDHWAGFQMPRRRNRTIDRELEQGWLAEACSMPRPAEIPCEYGSACVLSVAPMCASQASRALRTSHSRPALTGVGQ